MSGHELDSDHHIAHARRLLKTASDHPDADDISDVLAAAQTHAVLALNATLRGVADHLDDLVRFSAGR